MPKVEGKKEHIGSYVSLNRSILKIVGLYPTSGWRCLLVSFSMLLIVAPQVVRIYENRRDLGTILETSSVLFTVLLGLLKLIVWTSKRREIEPLITYLLADYWNLANSIGTGRRSCFLGYAALGKKFTRLYLLLVVNALLLFFGLPLIDAFLYHARVVPFPATYPDAWMHSPFFEMVLLSQVLATCSCAAVFLGVDTLVATALFHTCGHFEILRENFERLDVTGNHPLARRRAAAKYIQHHRIVLKFSEDIETAFSPVMFCQVLASNLIICLVGLQMSTTITDRGKVAKYSAYLLMAIFQLVLFCWPGDNLIDKSLAVGNAVYWTNWYDESTRALSGVDVRLVMARAQKPAKVTAGKFYVMCLANFATVLSTSMSYFTVLRSIN